jgi:hypothetical protein
MGLLGFREYLDRNKKLQEKPIISVDGDTGPSPTKGMKPPKAVTKGPHYKNFEAAQVSDNGNGADNVPYSAPGTDPGQLTADGNPGKANPLGDKGDSHLIYNPKVQDQRLKTSLNKTKTEAFLADTRGLNSEQYVEFVSRRTNSKGIGQILETAKAVKGNKNLIETLVREIKRQGDFPAFVKAVLDQPETYSEIAINLADNTKGKDISRQLAKALNEITAPPVDTETDDDIPKQRPEDVVKQEPASKKVPRDESSINTRGQPVEPDMNARQMKKQYVMMRPEHSLIEALANYKAIRATMKHIVD